MAKFIDLAGQRFGRLLVVRRAKNADCKAVRWECVCDCGNETVSYGGNLRSGTAKSCGCLAKEHASSLGKSKKKHGFSNTKEENAWRHMKQRCYDTKNDQYHNYGAKGISVCEPWKNSFEQFLADMGAAPSKNHSLDRINPNGNYEPKNCRWATWKEQQRNRKNNLSITLDGATKCFAEWCELTGVGYSKAYARIKRLGWSVKDALGV